MEPTCGIDHGEEKVSAQDEEHNARGGRARVLHAAEEGEAAERRCEALVGRGWSARGERAETISDETKRRRRQQEAAAAEAAAAEAAAAEAAATEAAAAKAQ